MTLVAAIKAKHAELTRARARVAALEAEIREAMAALRVQHAARPHTGKAGLRTQPIEHDSSVGRSLRVLRERGTPMRLDELAEAASRLGEPVKTATLVSNLSRYVNRLDTFTRTAPNTFGLIEWAQQEDDRLEAPASSLEGMELR